MESSHRGFFPPTSPLPDWKKRIPPIVGVGPCCGNLCHCPLFLVVVGLGGMVQHDEVCSGSVTDTMPANPHEQRETPRSNTETMTARSSLSIPSPCGVSAHTKEINCCHTLTTTPPSPRAGQGTVNANPEENVVVVVVGKVLQESKIDWVCFEAGRAREVVLWWRSSCGSYSEGCTGVLDPRLPTNAWRLSRLAFVDMCGQNVHRPH